MNVLWVCKIRPLLMYYRHTRKHRSSGVCMSILLWEGGGKLFFAPFILERGRGKEGVLIKGEVGGFLSKSLRIAAEVEKVGQYCVSRTGPAYFFLCANTQKTGFCNNMTTSIMFIFGTSMCIYLILRRLKRAGSVCLFLCFLNLCQFA